MTNVVQYDSNFNLSIGSSTSSSFNSSGSIIAASGFTGSLSGSVFGLGNTVSFSSSVSSDLVNLESKSASVDISITNINSVTSSNIARLSNLESKSSSVDISITNINSFTASNGNQSLNQLTGSLATTGSNTFYGTQVFSGSVFIATDLIVQGSSSIQYISASSVSIGTNIVNLNTATPSVRYAGISVQDSGSSAGITGSMLWDSLCNRWIYSNPSTIGYSGGLLMSGPRAATLGSETTLTCNYIAKSGGGDHLYDSCIIDDGTTTCIKNNLVGTGTLNIGTSTSNTHTITGSINVTGSICQYGTLGVIGGGASFGNAAPRAMIDFRFNADRGIKMSSPGTSTETVITSYQGDVTGNLRTLRLAGDILYFNTGDGSNGTGCTNMTITSCGCVGINTTSPTAPLTIQSTISCDNVVVAVKTNYTGNNTIIELSQISQDGVIKMRSANGTQQVQISAVTGGASYTYFNNGSNVGIGCTTPGQSLTVQSAGVATYLKSTATSDSATYGNFQMYRQACKVGNGVGFALGLINSAAVDTEYAYIGTLIESCTNTQECGAIGFYTTTAGNGRCERMRITSGGSVGIGRTDPSFPLDIYGTAARISSNNTFSPSLYLNFNNTNVARFLADQNSVYLISQCAYPVEIQTNNATKAIFGSGASSDISFVSYSGYKQFLSGGDQINTWLNGSGATMYLNYNGNGAVKAGTSQQVLYAGSDCRIKKDIQMVDTTIDKIMCLIPKTFKYKEGLACTYYGFIAQDMELVFPELVKTDDGINIVNGEEVPNQKSIESYGLVWASILTKAIQELKAENNSLQCTINLLKSCIGIV